MSEKDSGGPAFPRAAGDYHGTKNGNGAQSGMTLRDYMAAKALPALISSTRAPFDLGEPCPDNNLRFARTAYAIADAMLKARGN